MQRGCIPSACNYLILEAISLLDYITPAFHAGAKSLVELLHLPCFGVLSLLLLGLLILSRLSSSCHGTDSGAYACSFARISGNSSNDCSAGSTPSRSAFLLILILYP